MRRSDMSILLGLVGVALLAVFWFAILAPKRQEASKLDDQAAELEDKVATAEDDAAFAASAREDYGRNYHQLVVLGQAVPEDADSSSLLVELEKLASRAKISFNGLALAETAEVASAPEPAAATPPAEGGGTEGAATSGESGSEPAPSSGEATPAAAETPAPTEATAATLPIGAAVGPAGLPTMPYDLTFSGDYFQVADFLGSVDNLVHTADGDVRVDGRLLTVDGFTLTVPEGSETPVGAAFDPTPSLEATLATTTYLTPAEQGLVAGADPSAPAPTTPAAPTPTSTTTPAP